MTLPDARRIMASGAESYADEVLAASAISSSADSTLDDLLSCLRRGGLPAELAALELYVRTGRSRVGTGPASLITDVQDWTTYLAGMGLTARSA